MASILIFKGDRSAADSSAYATWSALRELGGDEYVLAEYADLWFTIRDNQVHCATVDGVDPASFDLVYIRDFHGYEFERNALALYLQQHNVSFLNTEVAHFQDISKLTQYIRLAYAGVPVPDSYYLHPKHYRTYFSREKLHFPAIVKSIVGSNGLENERVSDIDELVGANVAHAIIQPFLPNDFDYRVITAGDRVLLSYKRVRTDASTHRNNVAEGAVREIVAVPEDVAAMAVAAATATRRDLAGVDIIRNKDTGQHAVLEVNFNFGMAELGDGVAGEYYKGLAAYLHDKAARG